MFANPAIAPDQRWCAFLSGLKKPAPEFGGPLPTPAQHHDYRQAILQEIVNDVLEKRYAAPAVPKLLPYHWGCWALDFNAHSFRMKLRPGNAVIKGFTITGEGLRLELALDQVTVDCEYSTTPSDSDGNVALCILSFGAANIVELQWGDGTVVARDVCLPLEFVPKRDGGQIKLEAKLGQTFHADLDYFFSTNNMWALGPSLLVSLCLTLSDAFEGTLLEFAAGEVKKFIDPLGLTFPALFHFEDAPPPELDEAVMATNPGVAQLLGARVFLPEERAPVPLPPLVAPASTADFAITLAIDYLNGVLAHRLSQFNEAVPPIVFDWKKYLSGADLPPVKPPEGYEPFNKLAYPGDYEETSEEWAIGSPVFSPGKAVGRPGVKDAIGSVTDSRHIPVDAYPFRLGRGHPVAEAGESRETLAARPDACRSHPRRPRGLPDGALRPVSGSERPDRVAAAENVRDGARAREPVSVIARDERRHRNGYLGFLSDRDRRTYQRAVAGHAAGALQPRRVALVPAIA